MSDDKTPQAATKTIAAYEARAVEMPWIDTADLTRAIGHAQRRLGEPITLSFVGNFSVGKSNIINSLLGENVAPVGVRRTTAVICQFRWGAERRLRMHYRDGRVEEGELMAFKRFSDHRQLEEEEAELLQSMTFVEIFYPSEALRNITLVDTPGFGSEAELDDAVTIRHLQEADAVCWVFDAQEVGKSDEVRRVRHLAPNFRAAFAVVNKCDEKPASERPRLKARVEELLGDCFNGVLLYSADLVRELQEEPEMVDDDELEHLTTDLHGEIAKRVKDNADLLRARHAKAAVKDLASAHREVTAAWLESLASGLSVFEADMPRALARHKKNLIRAIEEERSALERRLTTIPTRHLTRFERSFEVNQRLFKKDVSLDSNSLNTLWHELEESIHEAFSPWNTFVTQIAARTTEVINSVDLGDAFVDNPQLEVIKDQLVDTLGFTVQHWSEFIPAVMHFGPLNRALGSIDGFVRTLYGVHHIPTVLQELSQLKGARLARFIAQNIDLTLPLEQLDERINPPSDGETPWILAHITDIENALEARAASVRERMVEAFAFIAWLEEHWLAGEDLEPVTVERVCVHCERTTRMGWPLAMSLCDHCSEDIPRLPLLAPA